MQQLATPCSHVQADIPSSPISLAVPDSAAAPSASAAQIETVRHSKALLAQKKQRCGVQLLQKLQLCAFSRAVEASPALLSACSLATESGVASAWAFRAPTGGSRWACQLPSTGRRQSHPLSTDCVSLCRLLRLPPLHRPRRHRCAMGSSDELVCACACLSAFL